MESLSGRNRVGLTTVPETTRRRYSLCSEGGSFIFLLLLVLPSVAAAQVFSPTGSMSVARYFQTGTLLPNGKVLITGGADPTGSSLASAELYDPVTGTFSSAGSM